MALLGYRVSQRSVLWPLAVVLFPAWILLLWLLRQPEKDGHTRMVFRQQLEARLHLLPSSPELATSTEELLRKAETAGLLTGLLALDAALAWEALGGADEAKSLLESSDLTALKAEDTALVRQALSGGALTDEQQETIRQRLAVRPAGWWTRRVASLGNMEVPPLDALPHSALKLQRAMNRSFSWGLLLAVPASISLIFGCGMLWRYKWPRFVWAERIQALWSLPQVLFALGLRGLLTLAVKWIIGFLLLLTLTRVFATQQAAYQTHMALLIVLHSALAIALLFLVKEIMAGRLARLHEVLGFDGLDLLDWRLWMLAVGFGVTMALGVEPLTRYLDALGWGGHALLDQLSSSPTGYSGIVTLLFLLQLVVVAPLVEEVIYRGFLLSALKNWAGPWLGAFLASAIFAAAHAMSFAGMTVVFLQALVLCFIRLRTRRLGAAMMVHGVMNLALYLLA